MSLQSLILSLNPDGYWRFNEAASATTAMDTVGAANLSTAGSGSVTFGDPGARSGTGRSVRITSTQAYLTSPVGGTANYTDRAPFSFHFWLRLPLTQSGFPRILSKERAGNTGLSIQFDASTRVTSFFRRETNFQLVSLTIADANWHQYAWTYDGTTLRLYRDGLLITSAGSTDSLSTMAAVGMTVGARADTGGDRPSMNMDELAIFNYALPIESIARLYAAASAYRSALGTIRAGSPVRPPARAPTRHAAR